MAEFFSVRMRASGGGRHTSGAERIVPADEIETMTASLLRRAQAHENGPPEEITITVESLAGKNILCLKPLKVVTQHPSLPPIIGPQTGPESINSAVKIARVAAVTELIKAGVSDRAAMGALEKIISGASPIGQNMRGAMLVDAITGERLEPDRRRGIRARAVDWAKEAEPYISRAEKELNCVTPNFREALALATKAANAPGAVAELCISDDPRYTTGYVASPAHGYYRIAPIKRAGSAFGGRAFFIDAEEFDMGKYIEYMRDVPVLISGMIKIS
ncbi:MAG: 6-carboxyhexanoate--CoA ligase [Nitrospirota bacterium]